MERLFQLVLNVIEVLWFLHHIIFIVYISSFFFLPLFSSHSYFIFVLFIDNSTSIPILPQFKKYKYKAIELIHNTLRNMIKKDYEVTETMNKLDNSLELLLKAEDGVKININEITPYDIAESKSSFNIVPFIIGVACGLVIVLLIILYNLSHLFFFLSFLSILFSFINSF